MFRKRESISINKIKERIKDKNAYKNFYMFIVGMLLSGISVSVFYNPYDVVTTGTSGLAIIVNRYLNIDLSLVIFAFSSILLVIGFCTFGSDYGAKQLLGTIFYPIFVESATLINKVIVFDDISLFLLILIGSVISGVGFGMVERSGYSLGGFYVLYDIIHEKFKISIGKANIICNGFVILLSLFVFGIDKCIYALIGLYISSVVGDNIMLGKSRNKAFYIITSKPIDVKNYIINNLGQTVTVVNAKGGYSNKKKKMLLCVISSTSYVVMKEVISEIDKNAFFLVTDSYSVSK